MPVPPAALAARSSAQARSEKMRITLSAELVVASLSLAAAFTPPNLDGLVSSRVAVHPASTNRRSDALTAAGSGRGRYGRDGASPTQLDMFDQLSSALTEVAQNFGGKQR